MLKETENEETRFFVTFLSLMAFRLGGGRVGAGPPAPSPSFLAMPMIVPSMLFVILRFCVLFCLFAVVYNCTCQSDTNGSILYDHAKYVILLVKVKTVLNSSCNLKL